MRTETAADSGNKCPLCGAKTSTDKKGRGFVRHLEHKGKCREKPFGIGQKDEK